MKDAPSAGLCEHHKSRNGQYWRHIQALLWILLALFISIYGNGKHDLITVARHHPAVWREAYYVGMAGVGTNIGIFLYLAFWKPSATALDSAEPFEPDSSVPIHIGTAAGSVAVLALISAFWPIWHALTPILLFVLFMGFIMSVQLLPAWLIPSKADYRHAAKVRKAQRA